MDLTSRTSSWPLLTRIWTRITTSQRRRVLCTMVPSRLLHGIYYRSRELIYECRLENNQWKYVIRIIQSILNHSNLPSFGNRAPVAVRTGLTAENPLGKIIKSRRRRSQSTWMIWMSLRTTISSLNNSKKFTGTLRKLELVLETRLSIVKTRETRSWDSIRNIRFRSSH